MALIIRPFVIPEPATLTRLPPCRYQLRGDPPNLSSSPCPLPRSITNHQASMTANQQLAMMLRPPIAGLLHAATSTTVAPKTQQSYSPGFNGSVQLILKIGPSPCYGGTAGPRDPSLVPGSLGFCAAIVFKRSAELCDRATFQYCHFRDKNADNVNPLSEMHC